MTYKRERCAAPSCLGAVEPINHLGVCRRCCDPQWVDVVEFVFPSETDPYAPLQKRTVASRPCRLVHPSVKGEAIRIDLVGGQFLVAHPDQLLGVER